jgi:hypothetical protein
VYKVACLCKPTGEGLAYIYDTGKDISNHKAYKDKPGTGSRFIELCNMQYGKFENYDWTYIHVFIVLFYFILLNKKKLAVI